MLKEFECRGEDGRVYIHYDRWQAWRERKLNEYPCPDGRFRFDLELAHPRVNILEVPVDRNPHGHAFNAHYCFYHCHDWSTIHGVHMARVGPQRVGGYRMLVESGNPDPVWGEKISLFSTSMTFEDEPWGRNQANKFAFFRNRYWKIVNCEFLHHWGWREGVPYPIKDNTFVYGRGTPGAVPGYQRQWVRAIPREPVIMPNFDIWQPIFDQQPVDEQAVVGALRAWPEPDPMDDIKRRMPDILKNWRDKFND